MKKQDFVEIILTNLQDVKVGRKPLTRKYLNRMVNDVISEAIADYEAKRWNYDKEYPKNGEIFVETAYGFWIADVGASNLDDVIRWCQLPAPYQEGGEV